MTNPIHFEPHLANDPVVTGSYDFLTDSVFDPPLNLTPSQIDPHQRPHVLVELETVLLTAPLQDEQSTAQQAERMTQALLDPAISLGNWVSRIAPPKILAPPGEQAHIESAKNVNYPAEFQSRTMVSPSRFDIARNGVTITITPLLDVENGRIDLDISTEILGIQEWLNYGEAGEGEGSQANPGDADSPRLAANIKLPVFKLRSFRSQTAVRPNEPVVLGSVCGENGDEPDRLVLLQVRARLLDQSGRSMSFAEWRP